ncbi:helix-turn-helix domain-containing protein [Nocardia acidivorans]|uniref:helix-turn-helix domain-containing protein n=1 Tax=Nocardia acidivorans TaxID=404580 RepID=UPI000AF355A1|nr:helix-turn-helix domain-containing protein [Nocardia acidivorans]
MPRDRTSPVSIDKRKRMAQALQLRETGANYRQIAQALDISTSTAHAYVDEAMKELTREPAESLLALELSRLDAMLLGIWKKASRGDLQSIDRALKIMERRTKYTGLDQLAALKMAQDGKDLPAVDAWLDAMLSSGASDIDELGQAA